MQLIDKSYLFHKKFVFYSYKKKNSLFLSFVAKSHLIQDENLSREMTMGENLGIYREPRPLSNLKKYIEHIPALTLSDRLKSTIL